MLQLLQGVRRGQYVYPRTVLAFLGTVLGIVAFASVLAIGWLVTEDSLHYLVPIILIFVAALVLVVLGGVFYVMWKDPSKLQVSEMSGDEFIRFQQLTTGDSTSGEQVETVAALPGEATVKEQRSLERGERPSDQREGGGE
jgi:hypothetical protein